MDYTYSYRAKPTRHMCSINKAKYGGYSQQKERLLQPHNNHKEGHFTNQKRPVKVVLIDLIIEKRKRSQTAG